MGGEGGKQLFKDTPPRLSEISIKNWRAKVKPVLTPNLWDMLKVWKQIVGAL